MTSIETLKCDVCGIKSDCDENENNDWVEVKLDKGKRAIHPIDADLPGAVSERRHVCPVCVTVITITKEKD